MWFTFTLNSVYNEIAFNEKSAITKENLCTNYFPFTYKYVALNEKPPITNENLCVLFFRYRQSWVFLYLSISYHFKTFFFVMLMTHTMRIRGILTLRIYPDIALDSLQCFSNGPMHTGGIFHHEFTDVAIWSIYYPFNCMILCCNWLKLLYVSLFAWFITSLASSSIHTTISS